MGQSALTMAPVDCGREALAPSPVGSSGAAYVRQQARAVIVDPMVAPDAVVELATAFAS
jgi:hypothetical protein